MATVIEMGRGIKNIVVGAIVAAIIALLSPALVLPVLGATMLAQAVAHLLEDMGYGTYVFLYLIIYFLLYFGLTALAVAAPVWVLLTVVGTVVGFLKATQKA